MLLAKKRSSRQIGSETVVIPKLVMVLSELNSPEPDHSPESVVRPRTTNISDSKALRLGEARRNSLYCTCRDPSSDLDPRSRRNRFACICATAKYNYESFLLVKNL